MSGILRPVELEIEGFRSIVDRTIIKFPEIDRGAVLINGRTLDGSTGSGTGKSSILQAMAFALDYCDVPSTELKSWYSKKMYVRFRLSDGKNTYDFIRKPKLELHINGTPYTGTATGAKEKMEEILKTTPDLAQVLTYRPQRKRGVFLSNTDAKNKEFLTKVLNLGEVENAADFFQDEVKQLSIKVDMLESSVDQLRTSLASMSVDDGAIDSAKEAVASASKRLEEVAAKVGTKKELQDKLQNINTELSRISSVKLAVNQAKTQNHGIRSSVEALQSEISRLQAGICPTCEREWNQSQGLIDQKNQQIKHLIDTMKVNLETVRNAEPLLDPKYEEELSQSRDAINKELGSLAAPLNDAQMAKQSAEANYNNLVAAKKSRDTIKSQLEGKEKELIEAKIELELTGHCPKIIGRTGFLGTIFDEVLCEIKNRSNDLMGYIPNINTFSLGISSSSVTGTGKVNKKIKVAVYKDGEERSLGALSGGQMASAELCTDLGVSETIRKRSGSNLGWVCLDEAMDGLDVNTKIAALEVIKSKVDGLIIVVDHSTEIKDLFDMVIDVEYDGKKSYVAQR